MKSLILALNVMCLYLRAAGVVLSACARQTFSHLMPKKSFRMSGSNLRSDNFCLCDELTRAGDRQLALMNDVLTSQPRVNSMNLPAPRVIVLTSGGRIVRASVAV